MATKPPVVTKKRAPKDLTAFEAELRAPQDAEEEADTEVNSAVAHWNSPEFDLWTDEELEAGTPDPDDTSTRLDYAELEAQAERNEASFSRVTRSTRVRAESLVEEGYRRALQKLDHAERLASAGYPTTIPLALFADDADEAAERLRPECVKAYGQYLSAAQEIGRIRLLSRLVPVAKTGTRARNHAQSIGPRFDQSLGFFKQRCALRDTPPDERLRAPVVAVSERTPDGGIVMPGQVR